MKQARLMIAAFAFASVASAFGASHAANCGSGHPNDAFGSCEGGTTYHVQCGSGTVVPMVGTVSTPTSASSHGAQACAQDDSALPIAGRVGVLVDGSNNVTVFADGDDTTNPQGGASAWDRVDVRPGSQTVCARRGGSGAWSNGAPDAANASVSPAGPKTSNGCSG
jgi:hypothetical protein